MKQEEIAAKLAEAAAEIFAANADMSMEASVTEVMYAYNTIYDWLTPD